MKKTILVIVFLYAVFLFFYLWSKFMLEDHGQCGRCVKVCSVVCMDETPPCSLLDYFKTYFIAAYDSCRKIIK